jgi:hypothetical protein
MSNFTARNKLQIIKRLNTLFETQDFSTWLYDPYKTYDMILKNYTNYTSVYTILTTLAAIVRDAEKIEAYKGYSHIINILKPKYDEIRSSHKATQRQKDNFIDWDTILKIRDTFKNSTDLFNYQKYVVLALYTEIEPLRLDYAQLKLLPKSEPSGNFLTVTKYGFKINIDNHKTESSSGTLVINIPEYTLMYNILVSFFKMKPETQSDYLLYTVTGKPMDPADLGNFIRDIFIETAGKSVGVNLIRHAYYAKYGLNDFSVRDAETVGLSTHSLKTGLAYRLQDM